MATDLQSVRDELAAVDVAPMRDAVIDAAERALAAVAAHAEPATAAAFLLGALAAASGARFALIAAALVAGGAAAQAAGLLGAVPPWWEPLALALLLVGAVQGALTLLLGREAAGNVMTAAVVAMLLFVVWRGPGKLLRLASLLVLRPRRR